MGFRWEEDVLLKIQIPGLHPRPPESLRTEPEIFPLNKPTWHSLCGSKCFCSYPDLLESTTVGSFIVLWEFRVWPVSYICGHKPEEFASPACQQSVQNQGTRERQSLSGLQNGQYRRGTHRASEDGASFPGHIPGCVLLGADPSGWMAL